MKRATFLPQLYALLFGLLLFLSGCTSQRVEPSPSLEVSVRTPTTILEQGRSFNVHVQLKNTSQGDA